MKQQKQILEEIPDLSDPYLWELEDQWLNSQKEYSAKELTQIFPEAKKCVEALLRTRKRNYAILKKRIKKKLDRIKKDTANELSRWFVREWIKHSEITKLFKLGRDIGDLKYMLLWFAGKNRPNETLLSWETKKEFAKQVSIVEVAKKYIKRLEKCSHNFKIQCVFHDDKNPSLVLYTDTNSFYCFGCQKGGSVITLIQYIHSCSFKEAVEILNNYYGR